jgi:hypothetical protein
MLSCFSFVHDIGGWQLWSGIALSILSYVPLWMLFQFGSRMIYGQRNVEHIRNVALGNTMESTIHPNGNS